MSRIGFSSALSAASWLVLAALSQGCGKPVNVDHIPAKSLSEAQKYARESQVTCARSNDCPESVGFLTNATEDRAGMCSSFLIGPDLIATNSHCIPDDLKRPGADCTDRIWVRFPDTAERKGEQIGCQSIISASKINKDRPTGNPDYAYFRLARASNRRALKLSRQGFADDTQFSVLKVNPMSKTTAIGSLDPVQCKSAQRSLLTDFDSDLDLNALLADCILIPGNSGSPVTDSSGQLRGIAYVTIEGYKLEQSLKELKVKLLGGGSVANFGVVTNYACLGFPGDASPLPAGCAEILAARAVPANGQSPNQELFNMIARDADVEAQSLAAAWHSEAVSTRFRWTSLSITADSNLEHSIENSQNSYKPFQSYFTIRPKCFEATETQAFEETIRLPAWGIEVGVSRLFRPSYRIEDVSYHAPKAKFRFEPLAGGLARVTLTEQYRNRSFIEESIPACASLE